MGSAYVAGLTGLPSVCVEWFTADRAPCGGHKGAAMKRGHLREARLFETTLNSSPSSAHNPVLPSVLCR